MSILAAVRGLGARVVGSLLPGSRRADEELRDELASHLEMQVAENVRRGMSAEEARRQALIAAGGVTIAVEAVRERRGLPAIDGVVADVRHALRGFAARPGFALATVITLAIGIGASSAIFSVVDAIVLHPLPYPDPDRIVALGETIDGEEGSTVDEISYAAWERSAQSMRMAAYRPDAGVVALEGGPEQLRGSQVDSAYFSILGIKPLLGRTPATTDYRTDAPSVLVLSEQLWRRAFNADPAAIGRTIDLDDRPTAIVGVMPAAATTTTGPQYWVPFRRQASPPGAVYYWFAIGRLNPGVSVAQASAELRALTPTRVGHALDGRRAIVPVVKTLAESLYGEQRKPVLLLFGAVGVLLLIACANLANLALVRAAGRQREFAVRLALGAGRPRLARMLLTESLILGIAGGACGLVLAYGLIGYFVHLSPRSVGNPEGVRLNDVVLAFTSVTAVTSALAFGIAPLIITGGGDLARALSSGTPRASAGRKQHAIRRALVVGQLATALLLLTGAALVARSFYRVTSIDLGFQPDGVLSVPINLPSTRYPEARVGPFVDELLARVRRLPGMESAALGIAPLAGMTGSYSTRDSAGHDTPPLDEIQAGRGYFHTIGARLLLGRTFTAEDRRGSPLVVIVNQALAQHLYPNGGAVGKTMPGPGGTSKIIGVVSNIPVRLEAHASPVVYPSLEQMGVGNYEYLLVRTAGAPGVAEKAITQLMRSMDPSLPAPQIQRMSDVVAKAVAPREFVFVLLALFAGVAATLAVIGLYGLVSRIVVERTREIGIRMALGADRERVITAVLGQGLLLVVIGGVLGLGGSIAAARLMRSMMYETSVYDRTAFAGAAVLLVLVSLIASYLPARRATQIDPVVALRDE